jgi:hypothetical protein
MGNCVPVHTHSLSIRFSPSLSILEKAAIGLYAFARKIELYSSIAQFLELGSHLDSPQVIIALWQ